MLPMTRSQLPTLAALVLTLTLLPACEDIEGNEPNECSDGADNDSDGYFDCEDRDCWGAPACDEGADDDDDTDDDDLTDDDDVTDDDDDTDDDDVTDDDDDTSDGSTPYIETVEYVYDGGATKFVFSIEAYDPDENFGVPLLLWSVDGQAQTPVSVGSVPLQGLAIFDVELSGVTPSQTYQVLFAIRDADANQSAGYVISATAQ